MSKLDLTSFPNRIRHIESEYRKKSGREIDFVKVDDMPDAGNAVGGLFLQNCAARIKIRKALSAPERFQTICHEMLHLELLLRGYPLLEPLSNDDNAKNLVAHLESLLQHRLIMPIEESEFRYDPYTIERNVAESLYRGFVQLSNFGLPTDTLWQFLYSAWGVAFARVATFAGKSKSNVLPQLEEFFKKPEMKIPQTIARDLQQLVQQSDLSDSHKYTVVLRTILHSHVKGNVINGTSRIQIGTPCFPQSL
jgi:hypothetical protein